MGTAVNKVIELETIHKMLSHHLVDVVWAVDVKTLVYEYISDSVREMSGYNADEYIGKSIQKTMAPDTFKTVFKILSEEIQEYELSGKRVRTMELELIHETGRPYWVEIKAKLFESSHEGLKLIGVSKDITERKKAEPEKEDMISQR